MGGGGSPLDVRMGGGGSPLNLAGVGAPGCPRKKRNNERTNEQMNERTNERQKERKKEQEEEEEDKWIAELKVSELIHESCENNIVLVMSNAKSWICYKNPDIGTRVLWQDK